MTSKQVRIAIAFLLVLLVAMPTSLMAYWYFEPSPVRFNSPAP